MARKPLILLALVAEISLAAVTIALAHPDAQPRRLEAVQTRLAANVPAPAAQPAPPEHKPAAPPPPVVQAGDPRPYCMLAVRGGREIVSHQPDRPFTPASTQKVLVAAAALRELGTSYRYATTVLAPTGSADGTVAALWLLGGGDPLLGTPEYASFVAAAPRWRDRPITSLAALADGVVGAGIRRVTGGVHGDGSRYEALAYLPDWKPSYARDGNISPVSALTVNSGWSSWTPERVPVANAPAHAAAELTRLLRERGVEIAAEPTPAAVPAAATAVAHVDSAPLSAIVTGMLRASDNVAAEMIARELGLERHGAGTTNAGTVAVADVLRDAGVDVSGVDLTDGSGLAPTNRATCRSLLGALQSAPHGVDLPGMLAIAGRAGTLHARMRGTPYEGRLFAKTGWIGGVVSITGRLDGTVFAIIQNGVPTLEEGRRFEEELLNRLPR